MVTLPSAHAYRPSNKQFYMETDTVDDDSLTHAHAYRPSNKLFSMETDTVNDDSLTLGPCIQAQQ